MNHNVLGRGWRAALVAVAITATLIGPAGVPAHATSGSLSGTVVGSDTAAALEGVYVYLYRKSVSGSDFVASTQTAANGTYAFSTGALAADTYVVEFSPAGLPYDSEFWNNQASWSSATAIALTPGQNLAGIDATLAWHPSISGHVSEETSLDPVFCADAQLIDVRTGAVVTEASGANATYFLSTASVPTGRYTIRFSDGCANHAPRYLGGSDTLVGGATFYLTTGQALTGKDATLPVGASLSGTVTGTVGGDISGMVASIEARSSAGEVFSTTSAADGSYGLVGLPAGDFTVQFSDATCASVYAAQWWSGASAIGSATTLSLGLGSATTGIDATLVPGAVASGHVEAGASGVDGALVTALSADGTWAVDQCGRFAPRLEADYGPVFGGPDAGPVWDQGEGTWAYTDSSGDFSLPPLPVGSYTLRFDGSWLGLQGAYLGGSTFPEGAATFNVPDGDPVDVGSISMAPGGSISGHLTFDGTTALGTTATVVALAVNPSSSAWEVVAKGDFAVGAAGIYYQLGGLAPGTYRVAFHDGHAPSGAPGYAGEIWDDVLAPSDGLAVAVADGEDSGAIDAELSVLRPVDTVRYAGEGRYETSVAISQTYAPGVPVLYVAVGTGFPDALAAAPAAAAQGGPLLLVRTADIPAAVRAEIVRLNPSLIVVAGGEGVVSDAVYNDLATLAPQIRRDAGNDRYETARALISGHWGPGSAPLVYIATGANFPDALSAASAAGALGAPVVTIDGTAATLDAATVTLLSSLGTTRIAIAGGPSVVSAALEAQLAGLPGVTEVWRLSGENRYATGGAINHEAFSSASTAFVAWGLNFPDALSGAALAGFEHAPLYIIPGGCLPRIAVDDMNHMGVTTVKLLGGTSVVSVNLAHVAICP